MEIKDVIDVFVEINKVSAGKTCQSVEYEYNSSKDLWEINFEFCSVNSVYTDCLIMYITEDGFSKDGLLEDLANIERKAISIAS